MGPAAFAFAYVVLPVHALNPPPQDPTLLRLTKTISEAIHQVAGAEVHVASREERDHRCPSEDGVCPRDIAEILDAERAVTLVLDNDNKALTVRVYRGRIGVEREGKIGCEWESGSIRCKTEELAPIFGTGAVRTQEQVEGAFAQLDSRIKKCLAGADPNADAAVLFKARPDGRVFDVRIDPKELGEDSAYACIATTVESLKLKRARGGDVQSFRVSLAKKAAKKK
jgi:hypothetical protein